MYQLKGAAKVWKLVLTFYLQVSGPVMLPRQLDFGFQQFLVPWGVSVAFWDVYENKKMLLSYHVSLCGLSDDFCIFDGRTVIFLNRNIFCNPKRASFHTTTDYNLSSKICYLSPGIWMMIYAQDVTMLPSLFRPCSFEGWGAQHQKPCGEALCLWRLTIHLSRCFQEVHGCKSSKSAQIPPCLIFLCYVFLASEIYFDICLKKILKLSYKIFPDVEIETILPLLLYYGSVLVAFCFAMQSSLSCLYLWDLCLCSF